MEPRNTALMTPLEERQTLAAARKEKDVLEAHALVRAFVRLCRYHYDKACLHILHMDEMLLLLVVVVGVVVVCILAYTSNTRRLSTVPQPEWTSFTLDLVMTASKDAKVSLDTPGPNDKEHSLQAGQKKTLKDAKRRTSNILVRRLLWHRLDPHRARLRRARTVSSRPKKPLQERLWKIDFGEPVALEHCQQLSLLRLFLQRHIAACTIGVYIHTTGWILLVVELSCHCQRFHPWVGYSALLPYREYTVGVKLAA